MQKHTKSRGLALLLILLTIIVTVAVILPTASSDEPGEIQQFGYQTLSALDLAGDDETDLRFLFTIGNLAYDEVGFVFSKTNETPTIGGVGCGRKATTTVYSTVTANGTPKPAPNGRYWVAVKLSDIPHEYFDGALYVRPYVDDGVIRYGNVAALTVCTAAGHTHAPELTAGYCAGCNLNGVQGDLSIQKWTSSNSGAYTPNRATLGDIRGNRHFYDEGNDLLIEYSVLWNESANNLSVAKIKTNQYYNPYIDTRFTPTEAGTSGNKNIIYWSLADNCQGSDCKFAGGFEWGGIDQNEADNPYPKFTASVWDAEKQKYVTGDQRDDFPNIGGVNAGDGTDQGDPQWGWHRVSIRYRQVVTNKAALIAANTPGVEATYKLEMWVYIDGVFVIHAYQTDRVADDGTDRKLYSASSDGHGGIAYVENDDLWLHGAFLNSTKAKSGKAVYFAVAEYSATVGSDFVQPVEKNASPAAATLTAPDGTELPAEVWYRYAAHDHVFASKYATDVPATCQSAGSKSHHCKICGASDGAVAIPNDPNAHAWAGEYTVEVPATCSSVGYKSVFCTRCGANNPSSLVEIPENPGLHVVENWTEDVEATLLYDGLRHGDCVLCHASVKNDTVPFEPNVKKWTDSDSGAYTRNRATLGDIRESSHFYDEGNDLLVEYSVLWNETATLLRSDKGPYMDTRFTSDKSGTSGNKNIIYWSLSDNCSGSDCKFAGGFEWGGIDQNEADNPYPKFTASVWDAEKQKYVTGDQRDDFPNIGGVNAGDGTDQGDPQWGWHRVSIRYRQVVTNKAALIAANTPGVEATYKLEMWVYIDGVLVVHSYQTDLLQKDDGTDRKLYSASSDGSGGIAYVENDDLWLHGTFLHSIKAKTGETVYFAIADYSATVGSDFVLPVEKNASPAAATYTTSDGTELPAAVWYRYATHNHVWAGQYTVDLQPTRQSAGSKSHHCTICGASKGDSVAIPALEASPINLTRGATVSLSAPTGLRFTGTVDRAYLNELKSVYGENAVKFGVIVTATENLTANSLDFTVAALEGCNAIVGQKYYKLEGTVERTGADVSLFNCVLSGLQRSDYGRLYSAVGYVEVNGSVVCYSRYVEAANSATLADVARAAYWDLSDEQTSEYGYACTLTGGIVKYSPYTTAQREVLAGFRDPNLITVMTYNIEEINGNDDQNRTPAKALQTIVDVSPDIVGLQEVDKDWDLSTLTNNGYTRIQGDTGREMWTELCYKTAKFNKLNSGYKRYSALASDYSGVPKNGADPSRDKLGRMFTWARLEDKTTGKKILAISTHLHYRQNKDDTASTEPNSLVRQYEIRLLFAWIADQSFDYDCIVIVGDMNAHYLSGLGKDVIDVYKNGGYAVTRDTAAVKGDTDGTLADGGRSTRPQWIFDYILTKGNVDTAYYTVVDNRNDKGNTTYPSDHLPIMAVLVVE